MQAQVALAHGSLDLAEALLRQIVEKDAHFGNDLAAEDLDNVRKQLEPIQIERLWRMANDAHARGAWGEEIGALRALAERLSAREQHTTEQQILEWLESPVPQRANTLTADEVQTRLAQAEECQKWAWLYENARAFAQAKDDAATTLALKRLWEKAPSYGDPARIAPSGVTPPEPGKTGKVICPRCGSSNYPNQRFCTTCGADIHQNGISRVCLNGHSNPAGIRFCLVCGAGVT